MLGFTGRKEEVEGLHECTGCSDHAGLLLICVLKSCIGIWCSCINLFVSLLISCVFSFSVNCN